ncbi:uncharacterized protein BX664DRAFT_334380 [Halteromyces radiatus]|uniref:uncharacterized protein n=1 Tax=Halteromyces radiatus TaxID=101107 RepID=UPI0022201F16|nr:uncharacterized protein BX664DRAFT_334380 [Halteromyces radiatus]KAI8089985.1 hypothetical protein BX664DRAFT_334380 [Halteromyces radiatus]
MSRSQKQKRLARENRPFQHHNRNKGNFKSQINHKNRHHNNNQSLHNGNKVHHRFNHQKHGQQQQQSIKLLPLPKGPLFDRSKLIPRWKQGRTIGPGFVNGQNTCFLNSVLECLTYTPPLAQYFLYQGHRKHCTSKRFCSMCAMDDHIHRCLKEPKSLTKGATILPRAFTSNLRAFSQTLRLGRQEDAHEFMMFLLDSMHKCTVQSYGKLDAKMERSAFIYQIFGGQLQSQLRCYSCNAKSNTFDNFLDLSVDLQQADSVQRALENFIKVDMIGGNDPDTKYRCDSCKQKVNAGKQMTIHQLPSMLCVHLKRFTFDMMRGYMRKVTKDIKYTERLDMSPYVSKEIKCSTAMYHLYAVLVHLGYGCDSGHYFAYVKAPDGKWFRMDDEEVTPVSLKEVLSQQAYMLFYSSDKSSIPNMNVETKSKEKDTHGIKRTANDMENNNNETVTVSKNQTLPPTILPVTKIQKIKDEKKETSKEKVKMEEPMASAPEDPPTRTSLIEEMVNGSNTWLIQSSNKPFRSLRGNMSPPTFAAAVSDPSSWNVEDQKTIRPKKPVGKKWIRRMKGWHVDISSQSLSPSL